MNKSNPQNVAKKNLKKKKYQLEAENSESEKKI